ncbi:hypothetical protein [Thermoactinospora rubra]|uniref:hypothetical protein n=1 Tax=Thermoactinospora rubra TaxID=1088767 RepID=UPI000A10D421|nr:hypothetical protein [Thermoactinospora rubra]
MVLFALPEPPHGRRSLGTVLREVPGTVAAGLRLATGSALLRHLMLSAMVAGVVLNSVELLTPGRLAALTGTAELGTTAFAVVSALGVAGLATAGGAYVLLYAGGGVTGLLRQELTHKSVTAAQRTTVTSVGSLSLQLGGGVSNFAIGLPAAVYGVGPAWALVAGLALASALLFLRLPALQPALLPRQAERL